MTARGVGIGLRRDHFAEIATIGAARALTGLDFVEIIPENYVGCGGRARAVLDDVRAQMPVLVHGVSLSVGGPEPLDVEWLSALKTFCDALEVPFVTEHLSFASARGVAFHELLPLPMSDACVAHVVERVRLTTQVLERALLLENPSALARMPGDLDEGRFTTRVLEESGASLLLDVNNVYVTAMNTGLDPRALLASMPLSRVRQIHVAGHRAIEGALVDTHEGPVSDPVLSLLDVAVRRCGDVPVLLEWDTHIPPLARVKEEAARVRAVVESARATDGVRATEATP